MSESLGGNYLIDYQMVLRAVASAALAHVGGPNEVLAIRKDFQDSRGEITIGDPSEVEIGHESINNDSSYQEHRESCWKRRDYELSRAACQFTIMQAMAASRLSHGSIGHTIVPSHTIRHELTYDFAEKHSISLPDQTVNFEVLQLENVMYAGQLHWLRFRVDEGDGVTRTVQLAAERSRVCYATSEFVPTRDETKERLSKVFGGQFPYLSTILAGNFEEPAVLDRAIDLAMSGELKTFADLTLREAVDLVRHRAMHAKATRDVLRAADSQYDFPRSEVLALLLLKLEHQV